MRSLQIFAKSYIPCIIPSTCPIHLPAPRGKAPASHKASSFLLLLPSLLLWLLSSRELLQVPHSTLQPPPSPPLPRAAATPSLSPTGSHPSQHSWWWGNAPQHWQEEAANTATQFLSIKTWRSGEGESLTQAALCASQQANSNPHRCVRA